MLWTAFLDARDERVAGSVGGVLSRAAVFGVLVGVGVGIVLLPYWLALIQHPIHQIPIPHDSRANFLLNSVTAINYFVIPYGALILALAVYLYSRRLHPGGCVRCFSAFGSPSFLAWRHDPFAAMAAGPRL